jgi:AcrR family transcriptional regulator
MIKLGGIARSSGVTRSDGDATKRQFIEAALQTLAKEGYSGSTARRIAEEGGFNAPLIFYHFGGVDSLLLASLGVASERRLQRYRTAVGDEVDPAQLIETITQLWAEDARSSEIAAISELIATPGFSASRRAEISELLSPWFTFAEEVIGRVITGTVVATVISPSDAAFAAVALLMGMEKLDGLDPDGRRAAGLFEAARVAAPLMTGFLRPATVARTRPRVHRVEVE